MRTLLWRLLALICLAVGLVGTVMPGLPGVPLLLVAAWAGSRGWPALDRWLLNHPKYGPDVRRWRERGIVPRRAKWLASGMMALSAVFIGVSGAPWPLKVGLPVVMVAVGVWLWRRPEGLNDQNRQ